jgi:GTP-binding protein HflX
VVDVSSPALPEQLAEVLRVLQEIHADDVPQVLVFNKLDRLDLAERPRELIDLYELPDGRRVPRVFVSAASGENLDGLRRVVADALRPAQATPSDPAQNEKVDVADDPVGVTELPRHPTHWSPTGTDP